MSLPVLHWIYGNQSLLIHEKAAEIHHGFEAQLGSSYEKYTFDLADLLKNLTLGNWLEKLESFYLACETPSLFAPNRIVQIDHLEALKLPPGAKIPSSAQKNDTPPTVKLIESLIGYFEKPPEGLYLILTAAVTKETDVSAPLLKGIKASGRLWKFIQYDNDSPLDWVQKRASQKGLVLRISAAKLLIHLAGNQLDALDQALEKLSLAFPQQTLTEAQITSLVHGSKTATVFQITHALSLKQWVPALEALAVVLRESPKEGVRLLVLIYQQFRKLLTVRYLQQQCTPEKEVLAQLKIHPFLGKQIIDSAALFGIHELECILIEVARLDLSIKFQASLTEVLFQDLFIKIGTGHYRRDGV